MLFSMCQNLGLGLGIIWR